MRELTLVYVSPNFFLEENTMRISMVTGKSYEPSDAIYMSNMKQCSRYLATIGPEHLLDILYDNTRNDNALVFVWRRCDETRRAKELWDKHLL